MTHPVASTLALASLTLLAQLACEPPPTKTPGPDTTPASRSLGLVRSVSWPGGGRELTIRVQDAAGNPITTDVSGDIALVTAGGAPLATVATREPLAPGVTAILVAPAASASARAQLVADLDAFVRSRPAGERIAVFAWMRAVEQVGGFTSDRARARALVASFATLLPDDVSALPSVAIRDVEELTSAVQGKEPRMMRAVVVAGTDDVVHGPTAIPVVVGARGAGARIDEFAATSYYRVALCATAPALATVLRVDGLEGALDIELPPALPETATDDCDAATIGPGARIYPRRIELLFTDAQRAIYDQRVADLSKADFDLSVRLGSGGPIVASAHLRGRGTLLCERKSYTVTLDGPGRHILPGARTDELYLVSMCADDRYVNQLTANQLLAELGLFPLAFGVVEVAVDGQTQGVYLMLEKAREELVRDNTRVRSVLRRRFSPPDDRVEVKYTTTSDAEAKNAYLAATEAEPGARLDLDQYLRFLAMMSAVQNGDFIDEIWLTSTDHMNNDGSLTDWFEMMAWDNDDLFSACHYSGQYAFDDPNGLAYCAEAALDHRLLADADVYARFVDTLSTLLAEQITEERFAAATAATAAELLPFFDDAEICAAMVNLIADNPAAADPAVARVEIQNKLDSLEAQFAARRAALQAQIATLRSR